MDTIVPGANYQKYYTKFEKEIKSAYQIQVDLARCLLSREISYLFCGNKKHACISVLCTYYIIFISKCREFSNIFHMNVNLHSHYYTSFWFNVFVYFTHTISDDNKKYKDPIHYFTRYSKDSSKFLGIVQSTCKDAVSVNLHSTR